MKSRNILSGVFCALGMLWLTAGYAQNVSTDPTSSLKPVAHMIEQAERTGTFRRVALFGYKGRAADRSDVSRTVRDGTLLLLDNNGVRNLLANPAANIVLEIPVSEGAIIRLKLAKAEIHGTGFGVYEMKGSRKQAVELSEGLHYRGVVEGDPSSVVAVSVFDGFVMGLISDRTGNRVLGSLQGERTTSEYILYNDKDMLAKPTFYCDTKDEETGTQKILRDLDIKIPDDPQFATLPVNIYFECDHVMYQENGSSTVNTRNFTEGMFNQVAVLYQNEQIPILISQIVVWTTQDAYPTANSVVALNGFADALKMNFKGHLAHLLSGVNNNNGGLAWGGVLCSTYNAMYHSGPYAYSNIDKNFKNLPTYSWTVNVVAHEMGHNFGSPHTHACIWNGNNTAIDGCETPEGNCASGPIPPLNGGTIMSYCHLINGVGINFNLGFGPQPGNVIRQGYQSALKGCVQIQCPQGPALSLVGQTISSGIRTFQSGSTITAPSSGTFTIQSTADVTMTAGGTITLNPPFNVINGGEFIAYSDNCMAGLPAPPDNDVWIKTLDSYEGSGLEQLDKAETVLVYPNPSSGLFTFEYTLEAETEVSLSVYDTQGRKVEQLLNKTRQKAGTHRASFDASRLKNDVYMYLLEAGTRKESGKLMKAR